MERQNKTKGRYWATALLTVSLLSVGTLTTSTVFADPTADSDVNLQVKHTQVLHFVDKDSGKVVGTQSLVLDSNGKTFADNTKLKLPSGYKRTDKFTYDLSGGTDDSDLHYTTGKSGQKVWNVFVSKVDDDQVAGKSGKTVTATTTVTDKDGTTTTTTTTTASNGSTSSTSTTNQSDGDNNSSDSSSSESSNSTSSKEDSSSNDDESTNDSNTTNADSSSDNSDSDTAVSSANSTSSTSSDQNDHGNGSSNGNSNTQPSAANSNSASSAPASSSSSSSSSSDNGQSPAANGNNTTGQGQNGANQTLPQTGVHKHNFLILALMNLGNWISAVFH